MKTFISAIHGNLDTTACLSAQGRYQVENLAKVLKSLFGDALTWCIITSSAPRAKESASIFSRVIAINYEIYYYPFLWYSYDCPEEIPRCYYLKRQRREENEHLKHIIMKRESEVDVCVCITHHGMAEHLAKIAASHYGIAHNFQTLRAHQAFLVDIEKGLTGVLL